MKHIILFLLLCSPALAWAPGAGSTNIGGGWTIDTSTAGTMSTKLNGTAPNGATLTADGPTSRPGYVFPTFGGDGSDGAAVFTTDTTLTIGSGGKQYTGWYQADGVVVTVAAATGTTAPYSNFRVGVQGDMTLGTGAVINFSGLGSVGASGAASTASDANGAAGTGTTQGAGSGNYNWTFSSGAVAKVGSGGGGGGGAATTRSGGSGGTVQYAWSNTNAGAGGGPGAAGNTSIADPSAVVILRGQPWWFSPSQMLSGGGVQGGGGGGGGGNGGGRGGKGGASAGSVAFEIGGVCRGAGSIVASGSDAPPENDASNAGPGKGATNMGSGGGGGGGAGGQIAVLTRGGPVACPWTLTASGGLGAAGASAPTGGFAGGAGRNGPAGQTAYEKIW